ncbi:MAG TPA: prephenate dehydrogenase/arogenate dehydrogenase family protein [Anaerolineaceae bacterium]|nr:prephenate dehydrogenase/arogenate dehydrogenase family protein [Anaerolineaceae bacterium]
MAIQLTLIGMGQIGASIGLALSEHTELVRRIGHDRDPNQARKAEKLGALDQVSFNLPSAVHQADLVILTESVDNSRETLQLIAQDLKEGAVVLDTSPLMVSNSEWAGQHLPAERHYVSFVPTLNPAYLYEAGQGDEEPHADLFKDSLVAIGSTPGTHSEAIKLASDLTNLLGATPFYTDIYEMDGLLAANHVLPQIMAAALTHAVTGQPGWREGRKVAGRAFTAATRPVMSLDDEQKLGQSILLNQANVVRLLDDMIAELDSIRQLVTDQDQDTLNQYLTDAVLSRDSWWGKRQKGDWLNEDIPNVNTGSSGGILGRLFGVRRPDSQKKK